MSSKPAKVDAALSGYWQQAVAARRGFELGLLIGVSAAGASKGGSGSSGALLTAVPVPPESEDGDARGFEDVSAEWAQEFAKQIDRLLPGGVDVLGLYVLSAAPARAALDQAALYVRAVADALRTPEGFNLSALGGGREEEEECAVRYVVHVCANSGKLSARAVFDVLEASKTRATPVELASGGAAVALRKFTATIAVDETVMFPKDIVGTTGGNEGAVERVVAALQPQLGPLAARVCAATVVRSRRRPPPSGAGEGEVQHMQLLLSASRPRAAAAKLEVSVPETLRGSFRGAISCVAFIPSDEPNALQAAAAALKRDFLKSLLLRAELVAERWADAADSDPVASPLSASNGGVLALPRRASLRWTSSLGVCGHFPALLHVFRDEHELGAQNALEVLGCRDPGDDALSTLAFLEMESSPSQQEQQSKRGSNSSSQPASSASTSAATSSSSALFVAVAVLLAFLAIIAQRVLL